MSLSADRSISARAGRWYGKPTAEIETRWSARRRRACEFERITEGNRREGERSDRRDGQTIGRVEGQDVDRAETKERKTKPSQRQDPERLTARRIGWGVEKRDEKKCRQGKYFEENLTREKREEKNALLNVLSFKEIT